MNEADSKRYMDMALEEAEAALKEGEVPVGAVIVKDGRVLSRGHNHKESTHDISSHAEIEAIREAGKALGDWDLKGCTLFVTLEPCLMCAGAIEQSRISTLVYGADDPQEGAITSKRFVFDASGKSNSPLIYRGVEKDRCQALLQDFFYARRK